ncbi:hypothetical protein V5O48_000866 [Marasmius crinis-equi]|uniref:Telomere-associated protein Rif1 N-terminal domain-containing protein n=1 Tax=Marasmius crinis-equi TaxID=585013 RepID=A0ABR3G023_9AGAR
MSLPTPPRTSHREEKENRTQTGSRVVWSQHNQYHLLSSPPKGPTACSAAKEPPAKSILKKSSYPLFPLENECEQREATPEPSNPLGDPTYLNTPVSNIISSDPQQKLSDLIEAYSVLAARIRPYVHEKTDTSCGIFVPLKKNRERVLKSIVRDLGRALVNPVAEGERESSRTAVLLPSPTSSPRKKRGMTAEQAKFARDLCTLSHSVLKLLGLVLTLPALYKVFTDEDLRKIFTAVLAIPLAEELPTPNARKTCALAICLIQAQRLPRSVLVPARDRIAYALRRGIDGELGKEGKKGSASDGLKAVHDLTVYQPSTFIPAFTPVVESVLKNLLAPSLALRVQACHALGGLAIGCAGIPPTTHHVRISSLVASFLLTVPARASPSKSSPSKSSLAESPICRTLRTTLNNEEPTHVAHGPVWALSVLASFAILLGPALFKDQRLSRSISSLMSLTLRHKKSSVRCLTCIVWRTMTWAYFQPAFPGEQDLEGDEDNRSSPETDRAVATNWRILQVVLSMGAGTSLVAACIDANSEADGDGLRRVIQTLEVMMRKSNDTLKDAMQVITQLLCLSDSKSDWDLNALLPHDVFSGVPGLLTCEFSQLQTVVKQLRAGATKPEDVRSLTREELSMDGIMDEFFQLWQRAAYLHDLFEEDLHLVKEGWSTLLTAAMVVYEDGTERGSDIVAEKVTHALQTLLSGDIEFGSPDSAADPSAPTSKLDPQSAFSRKLNLLRELWRTARNTLPYENLDYHADSLLQHLIKYEEEMNMHGECSRGEWASFCVELALTCGGVEAFWNHKATLNWEWTSETSSRVWASFVTQVRQDPRGGWEDAWLLLGVPFRAHHAWDLSDDDLGVWERLLNFALEKAGDSGLDELTALNKIAEDLHQPTFASCAHVAELLLQKCRLSEDEDLPHVLIEFVTDTLRSRYPPKPEEMTSSLWLIRALGTMVENCPKKLTRPLLETIHEGITVWFSDDREAMTMLDYSDVVTLYEAVMNVLRNIPESLETFEALFPLLEAVFLGRSDKPSAFLDAFESFWAESSYPRIVPSSEWPATIQEHFGIDTGSDCVSSPGLPPSSPPSYDDDMDVETTPAADILSLLPPAAILSTPPAKRSRTSTSTPCGPCKTPTFSNYSPMSTPPTPSVSSKPTTPRDPLSLIRSPLPFTSPVNKRRRMENKENELPVVLSALSSPARPVFASPSRKRRLSRSDDDEGRALKRARVDLATLASLPKFQVTEDKDDSCEDENAVEKMLLSQDETPSPAEDVFGVPLQPTNKRKRKAMVLESVEVPTLREIERRAEASRKFKVATPRAQVTVPRTPRREKDIARFSSPEIPELLDLNSDDSIMQSSPVKTPSQLSSDDDPHLGQVTPHHLISPALRRTRQTYDDDPPSDDSVISGSPSKGVVMRRMQRLESAPRPQQSSKPLIRIA